MLRRVVWKLRLMVTCYYDRVRTVYRKVLRYFTTLKRKGKNGFLKYLIANASTLKVLETSDVEWMTCESYKWLHVTFVQMVIFLKSSFLLWEWNLFFSNLFILLQKKSLHPSWSQNIVITYSFHNLFPVMLLGIFFHIIPINKYICKGVSRSLFETYWKLLKNLLIS